MTQSAVPTLQNPVFNIESSIKILSGGQSVSLAISTTSAPMVAEVGDTTALVTPSVDCFARADAAPVALSNGTDQILLANNTYRVTGITSTDKLAFITSSGNGTVYITPGA